MSELPKLIEEVAAAHNLNPALVHAVVTVESSYDTHAVRYEPGWRWWLNPVKWAKRVAVTAKTERVCQQMSWGLMQVMGTVARERGLKGDIPQLCVPRIGLEYGCRQLRYRINRHKNLAQALSAYNTGRPNTRKGRIYAAEVMMVMENKNNVV